MGRKTRVSQEWGITFSTLSKDVLKFGTDQNTQKKFLEVGFEI